MRYSVSVKEYVEDGSVISSLMGLFVGFIMISTGALYCLTYCVVRRFC